MLLFRPMTYHPASYTRVFAENEFGLVRFLVVCFLYKTNPNPPKSICSQGKSGPNATFNLIFLGLGWLWVGEFDGFMIIFYVFPNPAEFGISQTPCC